MHDTELNEWALVNVSASQVAKDLFVFWHRNVSPFLSGLN
jgi:hypothetical protein